MCNRSLNYVVQCKDSDSGMTGCFGYDRQSYLDEGYFRAKTPIFNSTAELLSWGIENDVTLVFKPVSAKPEPEVEVEQSMTALESTTSSPSM